MEKKSSPSFAFETKSHYSLLVTLTNYLNIPEMSIDLSWVDSHGFGLSRIGLGLV